MSGTGCNEYRWAQGACSARSTRRRRWCAAHSTHVPHQPRPLAEPARFFGLLFWLRYPAVDQVVLVSKQARSLQDSLKETRIEEAAADLAALQAARP